MVSNLSLSKKTEFIVLILIFAVLIFLRLYHLNADPPLKLSVSTDVYTDPPQYTMFARNFVQTGDFDPSDDYRRIVFLKSMVTVLSVIVFKILGTTIWTSHFVGFLYAFGSLFLFYLFIRKIAGVIPGIIFLILAGLNYNMIFYGRLPFLEHSMTFFAFLALVLLTYNKNTLSMILAGVSLGVGIYFGKMIGIIFLAPFTIYFLHSILISDNKRKAISRAALFASGFVLILLFWYFFTYCPMQSQVSGYYDEQAVALYGFPDGLKSFDNFVEKMVDFGNDSKLFPRMQSGAILSAIFLGLVLFRFTRLKSWKENNNEIGLGHLFIAALIITFYLSLMIWNYRPLRYQLPMIYAIYGAAAIILNMMGQKWKEIENKKIPTFFYPVCFGIIVVPLYQIWNGIADRYGWEFYYDYNKHWVAIFSMILVSLIAFIIRSNIHKKILFLPQLSKGLAGLILLANIVFGILSYSSWADNPTFTIRDNSRDLGMMLNEGAVVSGPLAPALVQENKLGCVIHMFGVSEADPNLFQKFPITHLLLDESNEKRAKTDYPELIERAEHILTYHVGTHKARLFRIAGISGNKITDSYNLTDMEKAIDLYHKNEIGQANLLAGAYIKENPDNLSGYLTVATVAENEEPFPLAEDYLKKAIEFSPTNYHLSSKLAELYKKLFIDTGEKKYKEEGLKYFEKAITFAPTSSKLKESYRELRDMPQ